VLKTSDRDPETLELVSRLPKLRSFQLLQNEALKAKERHFATLAKMLMKTRKPVPELEIEYDRGFWNGVEWALEKLPNGVTKEFERLLEQNEKESDLVE